MHCKIIFINFLLGSAILFTWVCGHGFMVKPKSRANDDVHWNSGTNGCDSDRKGEVTKYISGEEIEVSWTRNNHLGGFIRYSLVPSNAVSKGNFDVNAFFYTCREVNCDLPNCNSDNCNDNGVGDDAVKCTTKVKLPNYLPAGDYVLQWLWFAVGSSYGNEYKSTGNYVSCADIQLTTDGTARKPPCVPFVGGDRVQERRKESPDTCYYFGSNDYNIQVDELPKNPNPYKMGVPLEIENCKIPSGDSVDLSNGSPIVQPSNVPTPVANSNSNSVASVNDVIRQDPASIYKPGMLEPSM